MKKVSGVNRQNVEHSSYASILKYTGLFGGVQGFNVLISVLRNKCAAVLIGTIGIGLTDILNRTSDFIGSMSNLGISFSSVRKLSEEYGTQNKETINDAICTIRSWSVGTGLLGTLLLFVFSSLISTFVFNDTTLAVPFIIISPIIALLAIYGGEAAIMKGTRKLKELAFVSAIGSLITLVITVALYLALGLKGVPLALLFSTLCLTATTLFVTNRIYPWSSKIFSKKYFTAGKTLLVLGVAYLASGVAGSGAEILVRAVINNMGSRTDVGLYASGFVLCVTYTRLIFIAMDADYFPRLSSISKDRIQRDIAVCQQIDVCVLLMAPMLIIFLTFLPLVVRLLYSSDFVPVIGMCVAAGGYLFIKAIVAPIEYIPLANNDSKTYFIMELAYDVVFVVLVILGYSRFGLKGAGGALTLSYVFDLILILLLYRRIYNFKMHTSTIRVILIQGCLLCPVVLMFNSGYIWQKCIISCMLLILSTAYSIRKLGLSLWTVKSYLKSRCKK